MAIHRKSFRPEQPAVNTPDSWVNEYLSLEEAYGQRTVASLCKATSLSGKRSNQHITSSIIKEETSLPRDMRSMNISGIDNMVTADGASCDPKVETAKTCSLPPPDVLVVFCILLFFSITEVW